MNFFLKLIISSILIVITYEVVLIKGYKLETSLSSSDSDNLHKSEDIQSIDSRAALRDRNYLWDEGVVPYFISPDFNENQMKTIFSAMHEWESNTCLKFVPEEPHHEFSIFIQKAGCGCCSLVGKIRRRQIFSLNDGCGETIALHELGHAIGFNHEQQRPDRDKYIKVLYENIKKNQRFGYDKLSEDKYDSLGFAYDFSSIMHYSQSSFGIEGRNTMEVIDRSNRITYNTRLSEIDIAQTRKLYQCPKCYFSIYQYRGIIEFSKDTSILNENYCQWFIKRKEGEKIRFSIENLNIPKDIDCSSEYLEIRDGYWSSSPVIAKFCGNHSIGEIYESTKSSLLITYRRSHNSSLNKGFSLKYSVACGGKIDEGAWMIESEQILGYSHLTSSCFWTITVPTGYSVHFWFIFINMACKNEYVEIFEGDTIDGESLGKFCGKEIPESMLSNNNIISVKMISNKVISNNSKKETDFMLGYRADYNECESPDRGNCSDICINTIRSYRCE